MSQYPQKIRRIMDLFRKTVVAPRFTLPEGDINWSYPETVAAHSIAKRKGVTSHPGQSGNGQALNQLILQG